MTGRHFRPEDESELDREEVLRQLREILAHGDNEATYRESKLPNAVLRAQIALLKGLRPDQTAEYTAKPGKALRVAAFALAGGVAITVVLAVAAEKALPSWLRLTAKSSNSFLASAVDLRSIN